jgi:hypothetical protein
VSSTVPAPAPEVAVVASPWPQAAVMLPRVSGKRETVG